MILKQKILIAEDEPDIAEIYLRLLEDRGHQVVVTSDGQDCIERYRLELSEPVKTPFDVVIIDYLMPMKNGVQVAKEIKQENPQQRIIFVSGYGSILLEELKKQVGKIEFLSKPSSPNALINLVEGTRNTDFMDKLAQRKIRESKEEVDLSDPL